MADSFIQVPPNSTGAMIDTSPVVNGANTVQRQNIAIADPAVLANIAQVLPTPPVGTESGLVTRNIPGGVQPSKLTDGTNNAAVSPPLVAGAGTGIHTGLQVDPLAGLSIQSVAIDTAISGDNTIVAAVTGKVIYVLHWHLVANGAVAVRWKDATPTNLTGAELLAANGGLSAGNGNGAVLMTKAVSKGLVLNLSAAVQVSGIVVYVTA